MSDLMEAPEVESNGADMTVVADYDTSGEAGGADPAPVVQTVPAVIGRTKPLTKGEEIRLHDLFVRTRVAQEFIILEAFEGDAHKAVKQPSFEDYCRERLGLDYSKARLSQIVAAAKVQRALVGNYVPLTEEGGSLPVIEAKNEIPEGVALQIARLPENLWQKVYSEHQGFAKAAKKEKKTPAEIKEELKRIVNRELKELGTDAPKRTGRPVGSTGARRAAANPEPPATVSTERIGRMEPVVAPTYDGSEEQQAIENGVGDFHDSERPITQSVPEAEEGTYPPGYVERLEQRLTLADSALVTFVRLMNSEQMDVAAMNELLEDVETYLAKYGVG